LRHGLAQISFRRVQHEDGVTGAETLQTPESKALATAWSTSQNLHLWEQWLRQCSTSHSKCGTIRDRQQFSPSRLVEIVVTDGKAAGWRIVELAADDPRPYHRTPPFGTPHDAGQPNWRSKSSGPLSATP
jgi:hypothetical protein